MASMKAVLPVKEVTLESLVAGGIGVSVWRLDDERDDSSLTLEHVDPHVRDGSVVKSIGKRIDEAMPYVRSTGAPSILARVARTGTPERLASVWYIDTNFARAWYALAAFPCGDGRILVLFESILTNQRAGQELQRALLSVIPDRVFRIDGNMRYLDYFGPSDQLVTPSPAKLLGRTVREVLPEQLAERVEDVIRRARTERLPVRLDYELQIRGAVRFFEATFAPGVDDEVVVVSRDVTDRIRDREELHRVLGDLERRVADRTAELQQVNTSLIALLEHRRAAEYALRDNFARLQSLVDGSPAAIIELDRNGHVVSWSRSAERMFGWTADEAIGRYNPTVPPEQMDASLALLAAFTDGKYVDSLPVTRQDHEGRRMQVTMSTSAIRRGDGKIERIIAVYNRVEDNVSADVEELTRRMRELSSLSRSITRSLDLGEAMKTLERELARLFDIRSGVLLVGNGEHLDVRFAWGSELATARAMAVSDDEEIRFVIDPATGHEWLRAPLFDAGDEAGVLLLEAPSSQFDGDLNLLREVAREVTAAVTNARLFDVARRGNERLQELSRRLVEVQENERRHLGRELHDQIGQMLTGLKLSLAAARKDGAGQPALADAEELVADLLSRVRTLSLELRPPMLDDAGLVSALVWHVSRYAERTGVAVDFRHGDVGRLDAEIEIAAFRIVQEAMTNAARHGDARHLSLRVWQAADRLLVQIEDDGVGFSADGAPPAQTAGLTGMRERAHLVGGTISIESTPGAGTRVAVDLPSSCHPRDSDADRRHR